MNHCLCGEPILTLNAMYSWDNTIFDNIVLPTGIDNDTLIATLISYCGENEVRYPSLPMLSDQIHLFFKMHKIEFQKIWDTENFEYNPIHNYDRTETELYELKRDVKRKLDEEKIFDQNNQTTSNSRVESESTQNPGEIIENQVSAFNSSGYQPKEKTIHSGQNVSHTDSEVNGSTTDDNFYTDDTSTNENTDQQDNTSRILESKGNIGVTSTQQMIQQEREIANFSTYLYISSKFEDEITIPVYRRRC